MNHNENLISDIINALPLNHTTVCFEKRTKEDGIYEKYVGFIGQERITIIIEPIN